jgi:integrase
MTESNSTQSAGSGKSVRAKPAKPYPGFPLYPHPAGYWAKKIRGRMHYFGRWEDGPDPALQKYLDQKDDLHAGRTPRAERDELTVKGAVNVFLVARRARVEAGELAEITWRQYKDACDMLIATLRGRRRVADLGPEHFATLRRKMASRWGPVRLRVMIAYVKSIFKFALASGRIDRPVAFGPDFIPPSKKVMRLHRAQRGPRLFTAEEIRRLLAGAGVQLRAMTFLGINGGLGNTDCGRLPQSALDLDGGWLDFARPKTGIPRRVPLWPETVEAVKEALAKRPAPRHPRDAGLVFMTAYGRPWARDTSDSPLSRQFSRLLRRLKIDGRRGLNFYGLRHTFRTVADESRDQPACDYLMGHSRDDMASAYRERISDARLREVAEYVRRWLFPPEKAETPADQGPRILPIDRTG